jgi:hypothetical protein
MKFQTATSGPEAVDYDAILRVSIAVVLELSAMATVPSLAHHAQMATRSAHSVPSHIG